MADKELMQEALKWQEHIKVLANEYAENELYQKRSKVLDWLIEQAEKAEEHQKRLLLGVEMARIHAEFLNLENEIKRLREENKRLREALQFYADEKSWEFDWLDDIRASLIWQDHGETALIALEGTE